MSKSTRRWAVIIGVLLLLCVAGMLFVRLHQDKGAMVQIQQDGEIVATYPLSENRTLRYENGDGYNIVVIADGTVAVTEASCPDQVCVRHGPTNVTADPIVCLPNRLVVTVLDSGEEVDGVSK